MQLQCQQLLAEAGYRQYEVSAYALAGRQSVHNRNYWEFGDYFGLGAGAHGKLSSVEKILRSERSKQPREYLELEPQHRLVLHQPVSPADLPFEFMLNALRLTDGFDQTLFESRTGLSWNSVLPNISEANRRGLLESLAEQKWRATELGRHFLNDLIELFLPDN